MSFLLDTLPDLPGLRHLKIANGMEDIVLLRLPTLFPHITSFEYIARCSKELYSLPPKHCTTLQHLTIRTPTLPRVVRNVLPAFPALQTLTLPRLIFSHEKNTKVSFPDHGVIAHPLFELSSALPASGLLWLGVRLPNVKAISNFK